jgi:hypothetical protein
MMSVFFCPVANIKAPLEQVWGFLSEPANYSLWWDAQTQEITPSGSAHPGQKIRAQSRAIGKRWAVNLLVESVDEQKHQLHLKTMLPLGITVFNHITCTTIDSAATQVTFG